MKIKDKIRLLYAKKLFKKTILFSTKKDWEKSIRKTIRGYVPFFYDLNEVNPKHFDLVIPLTLFATKYINENALSFNRQQVLVPSNHCIDLCHDKERFQLFLVKHGFGQFAPQINQDFGYPYLLKCKTGQWGMGISIIDSPQSEKMLINEIASEDYFKQEYVEGQDEYTAHVIINEKRIVFLRTLKFTFQDKYFVKGQQFKHASKEEVDHSQFKKLFEDILIKVGYQGICCFNYKITKGKLSIFELNPRYGGSLTHFINEALIAYKGILGHT